jgi:hypothetical protein
MSKRSRADEEKKLVLLLVDAFGDTSEYYAYAAPLDSLTEDQREALKRSTPSSRTEAGLDIFDDQGLTKSPWEFVAEARLGEFTSQYHCILLIAYSNE